jgi:hypothetical protein
MQPDGTLARDLRHHYLFSALSDAQRARAGTLPTAPIHDR